MLGKSIDQLQTKATAIKTNGFRAEVWNKAAVQYDHASVRKYNEEISKGIPHQQAFADATKNTNEATKNLIQSANGAVISQQKLDASARSTTLAYKAQAAATKALSIAGNMLAMMAIAKGIELVVTGINDYIHRMDNAQDALEESQQAFEESRSEVEALEIEKIICILASCQILVYNNKKMSDRLERLI